jgi:hypothetical protein
MRARKGSLPIPKDLKFGDILYDIDGGRYVVGVCSSWYKTDGLTLRDSVPKHFPYSDDQSIVYCLPEGQKDGDMGFHLENGEWQGRDGCRIVEWERV